MVIYNYRDRMKTEEYQMQLDLLIKQHMKDKARLAVSFAKSNNTVKIGDIVTDHYHSIKVESIGYDLYKYPSCIYIGAYLKKNSEPKKNGEKSEVHQCNLTKINGDSV